MIVDVNIKGDVVTVKVYGALVHDVFDGDPKPVVLRLLKKALKLNQAF